MNSLDRELGMGRQITRRHFLQGAAASLATGGLVLEGCGQIPKGGVPAPGLVGAPISPGLDPASYPPLRSGLRGSHEGSFEMAHALGLGGRKDWGRIEDSRIGTLRPCCRRRRRERSLGGLLFSTRAPRCANPDP